MISKEWKDERIISDIGNDILNLSKLFGIRVARYEVFDRNRKEAKALIKTTASYPGHEIIKRDILNKLVSGSVVTQSLENQTWILLRRLLDKGGRNASLYDLKILIENKNDVETNKIWKPIKAIINKTVFHRDKEIDIFSITINQQDIFSTRIDEKDILSMLKELSYAYNQFVCESGQKSFTIIGCKPAFHRESYERAKEEGKNLFKMLFHLPLKFPIDLEEAYGDMEEILTHPVHWL